MILLCYSFLYGVLILITTTSSVHSFSPLVGKTTRTAGRNVASAHSFLPMALPMSSDDDDDELLMENEEQVDALIDYEIELEEEDEAPALASVEEEMQEEEAQEEEEEASAEEPAAASNDEPTVSSPDGSSGLPLLEMVQSLAAITGRGEFATSQQAETVKSILASLEQQNPTPNPTLATDKMQGRWELLYATTPNLFRSSPFFMAGRAVCTTQDDADKYNFFCDMHRKALAISTIGAVRQVVSAEDGTLVSEFEVKAGAIPFLADFTPFRYSGGMPVTIDGSIVSTADITPTLDGTAYELFMDTVEIKGSNIPGLRQLLDNGGVKLESRRLGSLLEDLPAIEYETPRPLFRTTYLDELHRISRDEDDNAFLYVKTSDDPKPTDYSSVDSDLGVGRLLEGFNDAVTKFYL